MDGTILGHDVQDEKRSVYQARIWEIFGFGTQYAWLLAVLFCSALPSAATGPSGEAARLAILAGLVAGNAGIFLLRQRRGFGEVRAKAVLAAGFAQAAGTLLMAAAGIPGAPVLPLQGGAGLLVGACFALHMVYGNALWAAIRPERVMLHLGTSAACAAALCIPILMLPDAPRAAAIALLPVAGGFILAFTKRTRPRMQTYRHVNPLVKGMVPRTLVFVAAFGLCMGAILGLESGLPAPLYRPAIVVGALAAGLLALAFAMRLAPATMLKGLFGIGGPAMIIGCSFVLAAGAGLAAPGQAVGCAFAAGGFVACDLFMWFLNAEMVSRSDKSPAEVLARSCLVEWAAMAGGMLLVLALEDVSGSADALAFHACLCVLVVVLAFVFTAHHAGILADARVKEEGATPEEQACDLVAERFGLSPREREVLGYLAAGRSVPFIQDALTLSQSTVKTHVRNIYRKVGVNNKQELIDLVAHTQHRAT